MSNPMLLFHNQGRGEPIYNRIGVAAEPTYADKVLGIEAANLIAYWPFS